jgi:amidophosphoribosyltransferase
MELPDKPREECGIVAIHSLGETDIAGLTQMGLFALQHRGQESCGICVAGGSEVRIEKELGLVSEVFTEERLDRLRFPGTRTGVGHTRYTTKGSDLRFNAQPITVRSSKGILALAHNGSFTNARAIRDGMLQEGAVFQTTNDSEVMINLIARYSHLSLADATARAMEEIEGGFSAVLMDQHSIIGLRDAHGVRPLVIGELPAGGFVFASEPAALRVMGATFVRDVAPGELVSADDTGLSSRQVLNATPMPCAFEWIYFARGDGVLDGVDVHASRVRMGEILAREAPVDADVVVGVPDSGLPAAIGYSRASGIPYDIGLYKSSYAGRTFINPTQRLRELKVMLKLAPTGAVRGKRVVLVDDSIVRGTTSGRIVQLLREAGATEVHFRVSSPPIRYPCFYGIDTAARKDLVAAVMTTAEIRERINADSLHYLSEEGLAEAIGLPAMCMACFNGRYQAGMPADDEVREALELSTIGLLELPVIK